MSTMKPYGIEVRVQDQEGESVRYLEAPLQHKTRIDVLADIEAQLQTRSGNKLRHIDPER